ncbi:MAG: GAF domain-containing protein [Chloroflexi bacterium]|nr:GAF domain-containing protein [Chloroflexota bacterium]
MVNNSTLVHDSIQRIHQLSREALQVADRLRQQERQLRKQGMALPAGSLQKLEAIHVDLEGLAQKIQEQQTELSQLRTLANTTEFINSSLDPDEVLNGVMDRVIQLVGAERGYIMLRNRVTNEMEIVVNRKLDPTSSQDEEFIFSRTIVENVAQSGEAIVTTNAQEDSRFKEQDSIISLALRSIICVPLIFRDRILGTVYCDNRIKDGLFGKRERRLLSAFADQAAIAIENAQLFEQIQQTLHEITAIQVLLDNILASIASGVMTIDGQEVITSYNFASETIFGLPVQSAISQRFDVQLPQIHEQIQREMHLVRSLSENLTVEATPTLDQRGPLSLNLKLSPFKDADRVTQGVAIVVDDMTELKKRDATLAAVRRYLPPAMVDNIRSIERLALGGERRTVTVLFVEVRSFDSFPESMTPRDVMESLNTYLTVSSEAIHHHAGLIDKFMGSDVMALFNTQLNPSDQHAWDALLAAMRMAADLRTLATYGDINGDGKAYFRIGIHSGEATLGNVGSTDRREFTAIGDTVNLAKRLQENAAYGQLIVSRETLALCQPQLSQTDWIGYKELEPLKVKGRVQAAHIYEIIDTAEIRA